MIPLRSLKVEIMVILRGSFIVFSRLISFKVWSSYYNHSKIDDHNFGANIFS